MDADYPNTGVNLACRFTNWLTYIGLSFSIRSKNRAMTLCESDCVNWRMNVVGLGIAVWVSSWPVKVVR